MINFLSCGFAYEKHVTGKYYVIGVDTKTDLTLSYKLSSGDCVGKAPGQLLQYGFNDTFLVAKTHDRRDNRVLYFIIDMTKDSEIAHEDKFRVGPLTEDRYNTDWKTRLNVQLQDAQ